jgi:PhnB protein
MAQKSTNAENLPRLSAYLVVKGAARALDFYTRVFGAKELYRLTEPSGKVGHAELALGGSRLMLADEYPDFGALSPITVGGSPVSMHLYVDDVDALVKRAEDAGATLLRPVKDEFFGDRTAMVVDPFGHKWHLATRIEEVSPDEMQRRWSQALEQGQ